MASTYKVVHLPEQTKQAAQTARDKSQKTMRAWLRDSTETHLPPLVESLRALGFSSDGGERKAARWAFDEATLQALAEASEETGLPQTLLLALVVRQAAEQTDQPAPPKRTKAKGEKTVQQKRVAKQKPAKATPARKTKGGK